MLDRSQTDTLRGLACFLLVFYHASADAINYLAATDVNIMAFHSAVAPVRMPLFSFLSGMVYALRPVSTQTMRGFYLGKIRRIVVPFITITVVMIGMKAMAPSATNPVKLTEIPFYLVNGYSHLWFLQAILAVFLICGTIDLVMRSRHNGAAYIMFGIGLLGYFSPLRAIEQLSLGDAFYLLPFFSFGVVVVRNWDRLIRQRPALLVLSSGAFLCVKIAQGYTPDEMRPLWMMILGLAGIICLCLTVRPLRPLAFVGRYSFTIYLFHALFIAVTLRLAPDQTVLAIASCSIVALVGSIAIEELITRKLPMFGWVIGQRSRLRRTTRIESSGQSSQYSEPNAAFRAP